MNLKLILTFRVLKLSPIFNQVFRNDDSKIDFPDERQWKLCLHLNILRPIYWFRYQDRRQRKAMEWVRATMKMICQASRTWSEWKTGRNKIAMRLNIKWRRWWWRMMAKQFHLRIFFIGSCSSLKHSSSIWFDAENICLFNPTRVFHRSLLINRKLFSLEPKAS